LPDHRAAGHGALGRLTVMPNFKAVLAVLAACWLLACGSGGSADSTAVDIGKVADVKSSFGPEFKVKNVAKTGIDQRIFGKGQLPEGLKFEPAECSKFVMNQQIPDGVEGNMAAVAAEGDGNRFITIALETSQPVPFNDPGRACRKVGFAGGKMQGLVEVIEVPHIDGARTLGVHRIRQTVVDGKPRASGELYNYSAHLGRYQVIVTATPVAEKGKPAPDVDTARARELLTAAVAAIRS
jgi:hypothetical protein